MLQYKYLIVAVCLILPLPVVAQETAPDLYEQMAALPWQSYPAVGEIGGTSEIKLDGDLLFLGPQHSKKFLKLNGNPEWDGAHTIMPTSGLWFAILSYEDSGHVKDDDKIDAASLLSTLKEQNRAGQEERRKLGYDVLVLDDWAIPPHYDETSHRLEWGTRIHVEGTDEQVVNYTARLLGRTGLTSAVLVTDAESLTQSVNEFHAALAGFSYNSGQTYGEYKQGDKLAEYGLVALIAGGAAAVATKSGFLKTFGIAIVAGLAAIGGAVTTFFRKLFRKKSS